MISSSKDHEHKGKDDCQVHLDKEGESCVIKIESVGQEKILKELLNNFYSLKNEINQLLIEQQQQPKDVINIIQEIITKFKLLEDQLHRIDKHVGDDHVQLNRLYTELNQKFDEMKQDLNNFQEQQNNIGSLKDMINKILQKLEYFGR